MIRVNVLDRHVCAKVFERIWGYCANKIAEDVPFALGQGPSRRPTEIRNGGIKARTDTRVIGYDVLFLSVEESRLQLKCYIGC